MTRLFSSCALLLVLSCGEQQDTGVHIVDHSRETYEASFPALYCAWLATCPRAEDLEDAYSGSAPEVADWPLDDCEEHYTRMMAVERAVHPYFDSSKAFACLSDLGENDQGYQEECTKPREVRPRPEFCWYATSTATPEEWLHPGMDREWQ